MRLSGWLQDFTLDSASVPLDSASVPLLQDRRPGWTSWTSFQKMDEESSTTHCNQWYNLESPLEGKYYKPKRTIWTESHWWQETRWSYIGPMDQRQIHSMGRNSHPHLRIILSSPDFDSIRWSSGAISWTQTHQVFIPLHFVRIHPGSHWIAWPY